MSSSTDNAQGTIAWASGALVGAGIPSALVTTGQTQLIAATFVVMGALMTVLRAWLRSP